MGQTRALEWFIAIYHKSQVRIPELANSINLQGSGCVTLY